MTVRSLAMLASLLIAAPLLHAQTTYTYTGNDYTTAYGPFTTSDSITGEITLASPLADDFSGSVIPTSFSFSDGAETITNLGNDGYGFDLTTDASGNITGWSVYINDTDGYDDGMAFYSSGEFIGDSAYYIHDETRGQTSLPGTWSESTPDVSATPEPSSLILLGTGALALAGAARRRLTTR